MSKNPKDSGDKKPSKMFIDALSGFGVGSAELTCGWCGRTHLCPTSDRYRDGDEDYGWEENCVEQHKEDPENTILHWEWDSIMGHELNGILFVDDCPCNGLTRYETFIWAERNTIRKYLKNRIEIEYKRAEEELTFNKLSGL